MFDAIGFSRLSPPKLKPLLHNTQMTLAKGRACSRHRITAPHQMLNHRHTNESSANLRGQARRSPFRLVVKKGMPPVCRKSEKLDHKVYCTGI